MQYTPMKDVEKFHKTFAPDQVNDDLLDKTDRRLSLIYEEYEEVVEALLEYERIMISDIPIGSSYTAKEELAKELADLLYVVYGTAEELGIPLEQVFDAVHESNMSKAWPDGTVKRNDFGKILKPNTYVKPDLSFIHDNQFLSQSS